MLATFAFKAPELLMHAAEGDLFTPIGPELVECVCALRCIAIGAHARIDASTADRANVDALLPVVVVACREKPGTVGYYPPGTCCSLPAATPIVFLDQVEPAALRPRAEPASELSAAALAEICLTAHLSPLATDMEPERQLSRL